MRSRRGNLYFDTFVWFNNLYRQIEAFTEEAKFNVQCLMFNVQEAFTSILRKALCCKGEKGDQADDRFVR